MVVVDLRGAGDVAVRDKGIAVLLSIGDDREDCRGCKDLAAASVLDLEAGLHWSAHSDRSRAISKSIDWVQEELGQWQTYQQLHLLPSC